MWTTFWSKPASTVSRLYSVLREHQRADQQHQRQRHLRHDERATHAESLATRGDAAAAGLQRHGRRQRRRLDRGRDANSRHANERDAGVKPKTCRFHAEVEEERAHAAGQLRDTSTCAKRARHDHSERGADRREQHALDEQLAHDAAARRADRQPHGDLALAGGRASQQQIREVGAGDQQHQSGGREQHDQRLAELIAHIRHAGARRQRRQFRLPVSGLRSSGRVAVWQRRLP